MSIKCGDSFRKRSILASGMPNALQREFVRQSHYLPYKKIYVYLQKFISVTVDLTEKDTHLFLPFRKIFS